MHKSLRHLIEDCWQKDPLLRPRFTEIIRRLDIIMIKCLVNDKKGYRFWKSEFKGRVTAVSIFLRLLGSSRMERISRKIRCFFEGSKGRGQPEHQMLEENYWWTFTVLWNWYSNSWTQHWHVRPRTLYCNIGEIRSRCELVWTSGSQAPWILDFGQGSEVYCLFVTLN